MGSQGSTCGSAGGCLGWDEQRVCSRRLAYCCMGSSCVEEHSLSCAGKLLMRGHRIAEAIASKHPNGNTRNLRGLTCGMCQGSCKDLGLIY